MSTLVFHVTFTNHAPTATQLTGTTDAGSGFNLGTLTLRTTGTANRLIRKSATAGSILVSQAEFDSIPNPSPPSLHWDLSLNYTDQGNGNVSIDSMSVTLAPHIARPTSDFHELNAASAMAEVESGHDPSADIAAELRKLNRRVDAIERLLLESLARVA